MWKRDDAPTQDQSESPDSGGRDAAPIGKSVLINGELSASEDLQMDGAVVGTVELRSSVLIIGATGSAEAQIFARAVVVMGKIHGSITATERVEVRDGGTVEGDIISPRVAIADGAYFQGRIEMKKAAQPVQPVRDTSAAPSAARPRVDAPAAALATS